MNYGINNLSIGQRIELSPACDLWAQGARFGIITGFVAQPRDATGQNIDRTVIYRVKMDNKRVRRVQLIPSDLLRPMVETPWAIQ
jgi:hypothetical protein